MKNAIKSEYHCFIAWNKEIAGQTSNELIEKYGQRCLAVAQLNWNPERVVMYLRKIYGLRMSLFEKKAEIVDPSNIHIFIVFDQDPIYKEMSTTSGVRCVYAKATEIKQKLRAISSDNFSLHASESVDESSRNIFMLTDKDPCHAFSYLQDLNSRNQFKIDASDSLKGDWRSIDHIKRCLFYSTGSIVIDSAGCGSFPTRGTTVLTNDFEDVYFILNEKSSPLNFRDSFAYTTLEFKGQACLVRIIDIDLSYYCPRFLQYLMRSFAINASLDSRQNSLIHRTFVSYSNVFLKSSLPFSLDKAGDITHDISRSLPQKLVQDLKNIISKNHFSGASHKSFMMERGNSLIPRKYFLYGLDDQCLSEQDKSVELKNMSNYLMARNGLKTLELVVKCIKKGINPVFSKDSEEGWYSSTIWRIQYPLNGRNYILGIKLMKIKDPIYFSQAAYVSQCLNKNKISTLISTPIGKYIDQSAGLLVEISEWRNGETLNCFLDNSQSAEDFFLYKRILTQLYFILDTLESHKIVHRDIWLGNLIFERSTSKLSLIDTSTACFLKDVAAQNNDKIYANLKHPDDKKSVGRIEDKIYKRAEIMLSSCSHFRFDGSCDSSEELYARLSSLQIPEQVRRRLILSGSSVLAILGIRKNRDIDVFCPRYIEREDLPFGLQSHNFQLRYIGLDGFWDLFLDPTTYFEWRGYKVLHPHLLLRLKSRRLCKEFREKDVHDIRSLAKFLDLNIQGFN